MTEETIRWAARESVIPVIFLPFPDMAIKGAQFYTDEAAKSGRSLKLGQSIGLARLVYLGQTYEDAMESARNRVLGEMIRICHHVPMSSNRHIVASE